VQDYINAQQHLRILFIVSRIKPFFPKKLKKNRKEKGNHKLGKRILSCNNNDRFMFTPFCLRIPDAKKKSVKLIYDVDPDLYLLLFFFRNSAV